MANQGRSPRVNFGGERHGAASGLAEGGDAEVDGGGPAGSFLNVGELGFGRGEADAQASGFANPALVFGLGDASGQVVADLFQPWALGGVDAQQGAADAGVLVLAGRAVGAAALAQGDLATFEVAEELLPLRTVGVRYSSLGRVARRRAMNARWPLIASVG